jgi:protein TonB
MYPNGKKGIYNLISNETVIPSKAQKDKISGTVLLKYVVDEKGNVTDLEVIQSVSKHLDKASIRVMKKMERWIPGKINGKNVRVEYRQPFTYRL